MVGNEKMYAAKSALAGPNLSANNPNPIANRPKAKFPNKEFTEPKVAL